MRSRISILVGILLALVVLGVVIGCSEPKTESQKSEEFKNINSDELWEMLKDKDLLLVDVHIPEQKHIKGTDEFIPYNEIQKYKEKLPKDKEATIVVYCRSGSMSADAAKELVEMGYENVYNLEDGIVEWGKKGYPFGPIKKD